MSEPGCVEKLHSKRRACSDKLSLKLAEIQPDKERFQNDKPHELREEKLKQSMKLLAKLKKYFLPRDILILQGRRVFPRGQQERKLKRIAAM